jgi:hypothetical protein
MKSISEDSIHSTENAIITIENALYQHSVITWSKLFGSEKEDTYYMNMFNNEPMKNDFKSYFDEFHISKETDFRQTFLECINMTTDSFERYVDNIKKLRDKHIAHTELSLYRIPKNNQDEQRQKNNRLKEYPELETAKISLYWLYNQIAESLNRSKNKKGNYKFRIHSNQLIDKLILKECEALKIYPS